MRSKNGTETGSSISYDQTSPRWLKGACCSISDQVWHAIGTCSVGQSGLSNVSGSVPQFLCQFVDHILENNWIDVLSQKIEKEPVSNIALANDGIDAFFFDSPISKSENKCPDIGAEHDDNPVHDDHAGEEPEEKKPKPNKNVDFFIYYVERKNAQCIMLFYVAWCPKLVKGAFRHSREDIYHRVYPVFLISVSKGHHFNAISEKCPIKKPIQQEHLTRHIKKSQKFTKEVSVGPEIVMF